MDDREACTNCGRDFDLGDMVRGIGRSLCGGCFAAWESEHAPPEDEPVVLGLPDRTDWTGMAIEQLDVNRLPENLRGPAAELVRDAAARRGIGFPRMPGAEAEA
jgi:hypothetical protein